MFMQKLVLGGLVAMLGVGCVAGAGDAVDDGTAADELSGRSWERFTGAWVGETGPLHGVVFTLTNQSRGQHYFADVDTGIRCVRAPCPSEARVEGYFTANTRTVTLNQTDAVAGVTLAYAGAFQYRFSDSDATLVLSRGGREVARLHKQASYCAEADDCHEQRLITPRCVGAFSCEDHACRYRCGGPQPGAEGATCGGIAGLRCATGLSCVLSSTLPDATGTCLRSPTCSTVRCDAGFMCTSNLGAPTCITRCATVRCTATTHCVDNGTSASCVPNGPSCAAMRCASGYVCQETNGVGACVQGIACGTSVCGAGTYCCNPLRNQCARMGVLCAQ